MSVNAFGMGNCSSSHYSLFRKILAALLRIGVFCHIDFNHILIIMEDEKEQKVEVTEIEPLQNNEL